MIAIERTAAVLLCAGRSRRFGPDNKLLASLQGRPLVAHAIASAAPLPLLARIAVAPPPATEPALAALLAEAGFVHIPNPDPELGKDHSLRLGLGAAIEAGTEAALLLLGDMPAVRPLHLQALVAAADPATATMSATGEFRSPPALFPAAIVRAFLAASETRLRDHLRGEAVRLVATEVEQLVDCDTRSELAALDETRGETGHGSARFSTASREVPDFK
ncbi:hypothetical protein HMF7854_10650 [Sphingomonas ginkgonis]|uniref:MobA-like NTP transferase domain-containing protein n=1 Tax=Sphingomonas ginkgonis TaxID=2315330 RepID=A0A3R9YJC2_9SPHN|nr:NTP transferase domain-containing protein [Sphingomonas ginkgonis]RST31244.1 hypothetical protein HMF7854_10650 [Sphingomonas ginkgonis]